jgi:hypothetical protein
VLTGGHPTVRLLKSAIQKAIRRGEVTRAVRCAKALIELNAPSFVRRLPIIVVEDVVLHPKYAEIVEVMKRISRKGYELKLDEKELLLTVVAELAECPYRDEPRDLNKLWGRPTWQQQLPQPEFDVVRALRYRAMTGGMEGDVSLLQGYAGVWAWRFAGGTTVEETRAYFEPTPVKWDDVAPVTVTDIEPAGVDFHCSPIVDYALVQPEVRACLAKLAPRERADEFLKWVMWIHRSAVCPKRMIELKRPFHWWNDSSAVKKKVGHVGEERVRQIYEVCEPHFETFSMAWIAMWAR